MITDSERKSRGVLGEQAACDYLVAQGYRIDCRNWRCKQGEIDIIATKDDIVAFVEVKTRQAGAMVSPFEAVNRKKQRRTIIAASLYLATTHCEQQPRFDVAAVTLAGNSMSVEHLTAAYSADGYY